MTTDITGREYTVPGLLHRFLAEMVDSLIMFYTGIAPFFLRFCGIKDSYLVVVDDDGIEYLLKLLVATLIYRMLRSVCEAICIWGTGGATPGKYLLDLRVVMCDTSATVQPNRVLVVPASNVSFSASILRALIKNYFFSLLHIFFTDLHPHNRALHDDVAGTIVVQHQRN